MLCVQSRVVRGYITNPRMDPGRGWLPATTTRPTAQGGVGGCSTAHKFDICIRIGQLESEGDVYCTHLRSPLQFGVVWTDAPCGLRDQTPKLSTPCPAMRSPSPVPPTAMRPWLAWRR